MATTRQTLRTLDELRDKYINDVRRLLQSQAGITNPNVSKGSERYVRAQAIAAAVFEIQAREVAQQNATMEDSAAGDDLLRLCRINGITPSSGSGAVGYVLASCTGSVTYVKDIEGTIGGLRYKVISTTVATDGDQVPVQAIDVGKRTNQSAGAVLTWTSPPSGSSTTAEVDVDGLRFGTDPDNDASLRQKLLDHKRNPPAGGNWSQVVKDAESASAAIQKAFIYPAVYGPSTMHVAITVAAEQETQYSREAPATLQLLAAGAVNNAHPEHADLTMTTVIDLSCDMVLKVTLPEPKSVGGVGGGWVDALADRWPTSLNGGAPYAVRLAASPTNPKVISVTSPNSPTVDAHIAIWSSSAKKLYRSRVYSVLGAGPYTVTLYDPISITDCLSGDYVMPDSDKLDLYCALVAEQFGTLGPGEKTSTSAKLPRAYRRPLTQLEWPSQFTSSHLGQLSYQYPEVANVAVYYWTASGSGSSLPVTCPVMATVGSGPYCLRLNRIGIYQA